MTIQQVLQTLQHEGHLTETQYTEAARLAASPEAPSDPWYVSLIIGLSAWIAAILFGVFLGILGVLDMEGALLMLGVLGVAGAFVLRSANSHLFIQQLAFALSLTSQVVMLVGLISVFNENWTYIWPTVALVEALIFWFYPDLIHRLLTCLGCLAALFAWCIVLEIGAAVHLLIACMAWTSGMMWWHESRWRTHTWEPQWTALAYGVTIGTVLSLIYLTSQVVPESVENTVYVTSVFVFPGIAWLHVALVRKHAASAQTIQAIVFGFVLLLAAITWNAPGILMMLTLLVLAYSRMNARVLGIGTVGFFWFLVVYYYQLDLLLWVKALTMIGVGVVLLAAFAVLHRVPDAAIDA